LPGRARRRTGYGRREQGDQRCSITAALADDPLVDLGHDLVVGLGELGDGVEVVLDDHAVARRPAAYPRIAVQDGHLGELFRR